MNLSEIFKKKITEDEIVPMLSSKEYSRIAVTHKEDVVFVDIFTEHTGLFIGKGGFLVDKLEKEVGSKYNVTCFVNIINDTKRRK
jgi:ribosomal protein S3